ncbi:MAG TPA: sigma-54 factor interaction domain-containing protein [Pyrinomonadaceae bacterium]|nr:sigma-54 factor interaction domain-containing protein [Pyrinomonadaceae bacterium]
MRAETASLEAHYCGELNPLTKRAAGAILKAAIIQTERCSHRAWQFVRVKVNRDDGRVNSTDAGPTFGQMSEKSQALRADIQRVARLPYNILITGETGTGKTRSAREIHQLSARSIHPFMELNCANLPEQLVEAELFGYRKGAFTGADRDHKGLFEESDGGTLFLDEIGDIPPSVQNKLLKAIDAARPSSSGRHASNNSASKRRVARMAPGRCAKPPTRLGVSHSSLKSHLYRARCAS